MASFVHCIRIGLMVTIAVTSLTTLLGWPSLVKEHWASGYGDMFIPGQMDVTQKRFLTGLLEMMALLLIVNKRTRSMGLLQIFCMYFRGAYLIGHEYDFKSLVVGLGSLASLVCLKPELDKLAEKLEALAEKLEAEKRESEANEHDTKKTKKE